MGHPAIRVRGLWKQYSIVHRQPHSTFYDLLSHWLGGRAAAASNTGGQSDTFWALRDVEFEIQPGEVVGVIGRNGAGKSTLLKILSRITAPSRGRIEVQGRLASLLEVGTGFHPELSGRENVFLNGSILGMSRREVAAKFDEIVAFAEVENFIDTPVKRYSSGMYVRLAFAVAAHLEPEVLVVDEVLAVGDAQFQRKCLGKLGQIRRDGRTILFVSHNAAAIKALCTSAILLHEGVVAMNAPVTEVLAEYMRELNATASISIGDRPDRAGNGSVRIIDYWIESASGQRLQVATEGQSLRFCFRFRATSAHDDLFAAFDLRDASGEPLVNCNTRDYSTASIRVEPGVGVLVCNVPCFSLRAGVYVGNIFLASRQEAVDWVQAGLTLTVIADEMLAHERHARETKVLMPNRWTVGVADAPAGVHT